MAFTPPPLVKARPRLACVATRTRLKLTHNTTHPSWGTWPSARIQRALLAPVETGYIERLAPSKTAELEVELELIIRCVAVTDLCDRLCQCRCLVPT